MACLLLIAYRGGTLDEAQFIKGINIHLREFATSPYSTLTNAGLAKGYYEDPAYSQLASYRGFFTALNRSSNSWNRPLEDDPNVLILRYLVAKSKQNPIVMDWDIAHQAFTKVMPKNEWLQFINQLNGTENITLPKSLIDEKAKLTYQDCDFSTFGFDVDKLYLEKKVGKIDPDSPAYEAGLREGQIVLNMQFNRTSPNHAAFVVTQDNLKIEFKPFGKEIRRIPQYVFVEEE